MFDVDINVSADAICSWDPALVVSQCFAMLRDAMCFAMFRDVDFGSHGVAPKILAF